MVHEQSYLLTEEELNDKNVLPSIRKRNPLNKRWSDMRLYLKEQVVAFSNKKWGSEDLLEAEKERRNALHHNKKRSKFLETLSGTMSSLIIKRDQEENKHACQSSGDRG